MPQKARSVDFGDFEGEKGGADDTIYYIMESRRPSEGMGAKSGFHECFGGPQKPELVDDYKIPEIWKKPR